MHVLGLNEERHLDVCFSSFLTGWFDNTRYQIAQQHCLILYLSNICVK